MATLSGYEGFAPSLRESQDTQEVKHEEDQSWLDKLVGSTAPHRSSLRPTYLIANEDWPAVATAMPDDEAYQVLVDIFETVTDEMYDKAMVDLRDTQIPEPPKQ